MDFFQAIISCLNKYAVFSGRASRSEYWYFYLFQVICYFIGGMVDSTVLQDYMSAYTVGHVVHHVGLLGLILHIFLFLPGFAAGFRRLHDVNRSAWWFLVAVTLIGALFPLLYWLCSKGTDGDNRFGPDPLASGNN